MRVSRTPALVLTALSAAALLTGCGGSDGPPARQAAPPVSQLPTSTPSAAATTPGPVTKVTGLTFFTTPTRNISCLLDGESARCEIASHTWTAPAKPADCQLDYGNSLSVPATGAAAFGCVGDTVQDPSAQVLAYGATLDAGSVRCLSAEVGVTCTQTSGGHGFTVSRGAYRLF
jgi:hypothetical protein